MTAMKSAGNKIEQTEVDEAVGTEEIYSVLKTNTSKGTQDKHLCLLPVVAPQLTAGEVRLRSNISFKGINFV